MNESWVYLSILRPPPSVQWGASPSCRSLYGQRLNLVHTANEANHDHGLGIHRIKVHTLDLYICLCLSIAKTERTYMPGMGRQSKSATDIAPQCCDWTIGAITSGTGV